MAEPVIALKHSEEWVKIKLQNDWVIVIQQVPPRPAKPVQPTCALPHCKHDGHFDTYSFRVSFEPLTQWNNQHIVDEPATSCKAEGHDSELGTTVTRSYWYHLDCFEEIFETESKIPLGEFANSIVAETRGQGSINTNYSLGYELHYLLEKWTAVHLYQDLIDQHGNFDEKRAIAVYGDKLTIMDTGIYTSSWAVIRRNMVECSYHFGGFPKALEMDQTLQKMRLSAVLTLGEPWQWQIAYIDELCLKYRKTRRSRGEETDSEIEDTDTD